MVGKRKFGTVFGAGLGDALGDGFVIGQAHDEPALACHKSGHSVPHLFYDMLGVGLGDPGCGIKACGQYVGVSGLLLAKCRLGLLKLV